jgi:small subunit ribosomal protein S18
VRGQRKPRRDGYGRGKYTPRRKVCQFCVDKVIYIDYKDLARLRRHLTDRAKIESRRKTGTCAKHQRALATALKRARHVALLPYTAQHIRVSGVAVRGPMGDDRRSPIDRPRRMADQAPRRTDATAVQAAEPAAETGSASAAPAVETESAPASAAAETESVPAAGAAESDSAPAPAAAESDSVPASP